MNWIADPATQQAAINFPLTIQGNAPATQFPGRRFNPHKWNARVTQPPAWPQAPIVSSPATIIGEFQQHHYLEAVCLVVSWGTMWRKPAAIWGNASLRRISHVLSDCAKNIRATQRMDGAWDMLTDQLAWSAVMTSKTLHFLCRALGFDEDPPVPIDSVIRKRVWPAFSAPIPPHQQPEDWGGNGIDAYLRYMTAIRTWADQRGWTTTETEATIFDQYK